MTRYIVAIALIFIILGTASPVLAAEPTGTVEGVVVNNTRDGAVVPEQAVVIKTYLNDSELESKNIKTDAQGRFTIDGLTAKSGYSYEATINFQGADYVSNRVDFTDGINKKSVKVIVWDSTTSDEALKVQSAHTIVYIEEGKLLVKQYAMVENGANLTYIGSRQLAPDKKETLRFTIPENATDLDYGLSLMVCCVIPGEGIISDTMAVEPGVKEIAYVYSIPLSSDTYSLSNKLDYPTQNYDLLVQREGIDVVGTNLASQEPVTIEGKTFNRYSLKDAGAGGEVKVDLAGLPRSARQKFTNLILMGSVALILIGIAGYFIVRRKQPQPAAVAASSSGNTLSRQKRLIAEIARLDDSFETGQLDEDVYNRQRAAKKAELLRLMRSQNRKNPPASRG